jgi:hypothetical protein
LDQRVGCIEFPLHFGERRKEEVNGERSDQSDRAEDHRERGAGRRVGRLGRHGRSISRFAPNGQKNRVAEPNGVYRGSVIDSVIYMETTHGPQSGET